MGCDIHAFIEYNETPKVGRYDHFGSPYIGRNYTLFGLLAGVRGPLKPLVSPRGMPDNASLLAGNEYTLITSDNSDYANLPGYISTERAEECVANGRSSWAGDYCIVNPNWHTPSWVTTEEFAEVLRLYADGDGWAVPCEWRAILAAMKELPNARLLFWFDN